MKYKFIILLIFSIIFFGCNKNDNIIPVVQKYYNNSNISKEEPYQSLIQQFIDLRDEITDHIRNKNINLLELKKAYLSKDENRILNVLQYSKKDFEELTNNLLILENKVLSKHPEIKSLTSKNMVQPCSSCYDDFFKNDKYVNVIRITNIHKELSLKKPLTCKWGPYLASLVVCGTLGPVFYWPCAYVAVCSFCSGGAADTMCQ